MFDYKNAGVTAHKMHFTAAQFGLSPKSTRQDLLKVLSDISEGRATCRYERANAMVLFIGIPGVEKSGAVYIFAKRDGELWLLDFPHCDDGNLTKGQCEHLFAQYHLAELAYRPNLVFPAKNSDARRTGHKG